MSSFDYISENKALGSRVKVGDEKGLAIEMEKIGNNSKLLEENLVRAQKQVAEKFYWSKIISNLVEALGKK